MDGGLREAAHGRHAGRRLNGRLGRPGRERLAGVGRDDVACLEAPVEEAVERSQQRSDQRRDRGHDGDADHQGRRRRGGPPRVAGRVGPAEPATHPLDHRQRRADDPGHRGGNQRHEHRHPQEDDEGTEPDRQHRLADDADDEAGDAGGEQEDAEHRPPAQRSLGDDDVVSHCGDRRDPGRPHRGEHRREHRDQRSDRQADDDRPGEDLQARRRQAEEALQEEVEPIGQGDAEPETYARAEQPRQQGLAHHGGQHLPPAGSDGPEQGELPGALPDQDGEGVEDEERADQQGDDGEDEQEGVEEVEERVEARRGLRGCLGGADRLVVRRHDGTHPGDELVGGDAGRGPDVDLGEEVGPAGHCLRRRGVEGDQ